MMKLSCQIMPAASAIMQALIIYVALALFERPPTPRRQATDVMARTAIAPLIKAMPRSNTKSSGSFAQCAAGSNNRIGVASRTTAAAITRIRS